MLYLLFVIAMSETNCANASLGKTGKENKVTKKHSEVNLRSEVSHREVKVTLKFAISMELQRLKRQFLRHYNVTTSEVRTSQ